MRMKTGDLEPPLKITLSAIDPVDITSATAIRVIGRQDKAILFDRAPTTVALNGDTSVVTMDWQAPDTDSLGFIALEVEVMWPGGRPQTFAPLEGIRLVADFDL